MPNLGVMRRTVDQYQKDLGGYQKEVRQFNFDADVYNKQLKEYQGIVDAYNNDPKVVSYNQAAKNYNEVLLPQYQQAVKTYNDNVPEYNRQLDEATRRSNELSDQYTWDPNHLTFEMMIRAREDLANLRSRIDASKPTAPSQPTAEGLPQRPGDFTAVKPEFTAEAPKDPGFTNQQMQALAGKQTAAQQERNKDSGLVSGAQEALKQSRDEGSMIGGLLARARYST